MKNKSIYPWVVVGLLWIVALLNYNGPPNAFYYARSYESRYCRTE